TDRMAGNFCVVQFVEEGTCEAVPAGWVNHCTNTCKFPMQIGPKVLGLRRNPLSKPLDSWKSHPVEIKCTLASFLEACKKATKYQFTSNIDSSDESNSEIDVSRRKRRKVQKKVLFSPEIAPTKKQKKRKVQLQKLSDSEKSENSGLEGTSSTVALLEPLHHNPDLPPNLPENSYQTKITLVDNVGNLIHENRPKSSDQPDISSIIFETEREPASVLQTGLTQSEDDANCRWNSFLQEFKRFQRVILNEVQEVKTELLIIKSAIAKQSAVEETRCPISLPIKNQVD
ncbi:unnamed protein product, partial [Allacma fusca]